MLIRVRNLINFSQTIERMDVGFAGVSVERAVCWALKDPLLYGRKL